VGFGQFCAAVQNQNLPQRNILWIVRYPSPQNYHLFLQVFLKNAPRVAKYAIKNELFALAESGRLNHKEPAFQASSPKTSKARSATTGLFFMLRRGSKFRVAGSLPRDLRILFRHRAFAIRPERS
jgi:hypothetical protein